MHDEIFAMLNIFLQVCCFSRTDRISCHFPIPRLVDEKQEWIRESIFFETDYMRVEGKQSFQISQLVQNQV